MTQHKLKFGRTEVKVHTTKTPPNPPPPVTFTITVDLPGNSVKSFKKDIEHLAGLPRLSPEGEVTFSTVSSLGGPLALRLAVEDL